MGGVIQRRARPRPNDCTLPLPQANRAPAARCAGWFQARAPEPSSTTIHRRRGRRAPPHAPLRRAAPARRPRVRGAAPAQTLASSRSRRPAFRSTLRSRPISTRNRARCDSSASFAPNARAMSASLGTSPGHASPSARASANNTGRFASEITLPASRTTWRQASTTNAFDASNASTSSSRRSRSSPLAIRRAAGVFETSERAFDFRRQRRNAGVARCTPGPRERGARRLRPQAPHRDARDHQLMDGPRRGRERRGVELRERTLGIVDAPDQQEAPDLELPCMRGVHAVAMRPRASPSRHRALSPASPGRARRARPRPRRRRTSRVPPPLSDRRHAPHVAAEPSLEPDRRAAPSRCLAAREPARRRAVRRASTRRADHPQRVHAPQR